MAYNPILDADSYKFSHFGAYPPYVVGLYSYIEARTVHDEMVFFGLQYWLQKYLSQGVTAENVDEAAVMAAAHGVPFNRVAWDAIVSNGGHLPIKIWAMPEGSVVQSGAPLVAVECVDDRFFWLATYIETALQRAVWYPTTIASRGRYTKRVLADFAIETGMPVDVVNFQLHDFGARGVSSYESAGIGGAAHLVNFMGTDTMSALQVARDFYGEPCAGYSVPATEHSVQCSWGPQRQPQYLEHVIRTYGKPDGIVSLVLDGYDLDREIDALCALAPLAKEIGCKIVFRPDSGDATRNVLRILHRAADAFGTTETATGHKLITGAAVLQGDGVDDAAITDILVTTSRAGFASGNIVFGSGGALLQKVNRDTYRFAMKASAILVDGEWRPIFKDPATDHSKRSKGGRVATLDDGAIGLIDDPNCAMSVVYDHGTFSPRLSLAEIRKRAAI
jgi:nicotinamide phosphoribosyltransferase